jgi:DNA-binding response OmpR family regulator
MRILLVEDEKYIAQPLAALLRKKQISVDLAYDGPTGLAYAQTGVYDVVVLDIMLPGMDGLTVTSTLRHDGIVTPIILLTARTSTDDIIAGLNAGADDYLTKPFHSDELHARIKALARRRLGLAADNTLSAGDLQFSPQTLIVSSGLQKLRLTVKTAQLLELLMVNRNIIVPKNTIIAKLWGFDTSADANHVEALISQLRKSLNKLNTRARIRTFRNLGYMLETGDDQI